MIKIELITENELNRRFDSLPARLKDLLADKQAYQAVVKICQNHHLADEEKILIMQQLVALVVFGFLHLEDLAREIDEALVLNNHQLSKSLADEIAGKIFSSLKEELEKNYRPISEVVDKQKISTSFSPPARPADKKSVPETLKPIPPHPVMIAEDAAPAEKKTVGEKPPIPQQAPPVRLTPTSGAQQPKTLSEIEGRGLENLGPDRMAVKEVEPPKPAPVFKPSAPSAPARPVVGEIKSPLGTSKSSSEGPLGIVEEIKNLERSGAELVDVLKKKENVAAPSQFPQTQTPPKPPMTPPFQAPRPPITEKPSAPAQPSGPVMIHQESDQEPIHPVSSFHLEPPASQFSSLGQKDETRPVVKIELGGNKPLPEILAKTDVIKPPRVVHYNTLQTPLENPPGASVPKTPSFPTPPPIIKPEPAMLKPQPSTSSFSQPSLAPKPQGAQKITTVNYGVDTAPPQEGPTKLNAVFPKPPEKHSSWLRSIFSKDQNSTPRDSSFVPPPPPIPPAPRPSQPRPVSEPVPQPTATFQPAPKIMAGVPPQKAFDIRAQEISPEPKKENSQNIFDERPGRPNPPNFSDEKLNRVNLPPNEGMIDLNSLKKVE